MAASYSTNDVTAFDRHTAARGRSESDGYRSLSVRSSEDEDRAPLTTFFGSQQWQRMSANLPSGVRDPLNIDELEREERLLMPSGNINAIGSIATLTTPITASSSGAGSKSAFLGGNAGNITNGEKLGSRHISGISASFLASSSNATGNTNGIHQIFSEKSGGGVNSFTAGIGINEKQTPLDWAYIQDHNLRNGGLPTLDQVLTRKTRAPLALRDFAVHCSVRQPQARRWLEFYMAARTHEKMCLAYESDLRHAKARSQYASTDSRVLPQDKFNSGIPGSLYKGMDDNRKSKFTSQLDGLSDTQRRNVAHNATIESLSRGGRNDNDDDILYPEDSDNVDPHAQFGGDNGFKRSHRQSTRMALQIQTAAETIFLRYFRAALDPNLLQGGSPSYWNTRNVAGGGTSKTAVGNNNGGSLGVSSLKRMLTQKASNGSNGSRNYKGLHLPQSSLRPTLDDPYHQGYGVAATDSIYGVGSGVPAVIPPPNAEKHSDGGRISGAGSEYNNNVGVLGSPTSLTMSREHLNQPITLDGSHSGIRQQPGDHHHHQQPHLLRLHQGIRTTMTSNLSGSMNGGVFTSQRRNHLYYHMPWPPEILTDIEQKLLHDGAALDSKLFSEALMYAYDILDTYYFPIFLGDATSRNVTRDHCILRVFIGFFFLWLGFALPLALILLDHEPKATRVWSLLPLLIGWWNMSVGFGGCDLLLAAMRKYQSPTLKNQDSVNNNSRGGKHASKDTFDSGRSSKKRSFFASAGGDGLSGWRRAWFSTRMSLDMTATRMVRARSIRWFIGAILLTAITTAILCAVPGTRIYKD
ncbi:Bud site selection protein, Revert to axial protein 1 [Dipsacomyces acuminosporus]|nr:Bud site selection protein, Revert to axial protein 1 [Dipsacomyces acuminosporus]